MNKTVIVWTLAFAFVSFVLWLEHSRNDKTSPPVTTKTDIVSPSIVPYEHPMEKVMKKEADYYYDMHKAYTDSVYRYDVKIYYAKTKRDSIAYKERLDFYRDERTYYYKKLEDSYKRYLVNKANQ